MKSKLFKGTLISWQELFEEAATFATELGPAQVRAVSHSASGGRGIVTVWYTERDEPKDATENTESPGTTDTTDTTENTENPDTTDTTEIPLRLAFEFERGTLISWELLFQAAAEKAERLLPEQLVSISHSDDNGNGLAVVWYWSS